MYIQNLILSRIQILTSELKVKELKRDWIELGYSKYNWDNEQISNFDFEEGFNRLIKDGIITFQGASKFRINK